MNKKTLRIIAGCLAAVMFLQPVGYISAAWTASANAQVSLSEGQTPSDVIETVTSETDLRLLADDSVWNTGDAKSDHTTRKIIKLQNDITFHTHDLSINTKSNLCDMVITADCNLDLNGKTLDLSGHQLVFKNDYHGQLAIYNGTVTNGEIVVEMPNAILMTDNAALTETAEITHVLESSNTALLADYIFDKVDTALYHGDTAGCFYGDIPLPATIGPYDVTFAYTSSSSLVDSVGKVNTAALVIPTDVVITLTLTFSDNTTASRDYQLRLIPHADYSSWTQELTSYFWGNVFSHYLQADDSYVISNRTILPIYNEYLSSDTVVYSYRAYVYDEYAAGFKGEERAAYIQNLDSALCLNSDIGSATLLLECTSTIGGISHTVAKKIIIQSRSDCAVIANDVINRLYPSGERLVNKTVSGYDYTDSYLIDNINYVLDNGNTISSYGITDIEYSLYTGTSAQPHKTYFIENTPSNLQNQDGNPEVQVVPNGVEPDTLNVAIIEAVISFGATTQTVAYIRVIYDDLTGDYNFAPYYYYLDNLMMTSRTNYFATIKSFTLPAIIGKKPFIEYMLTQVDAQGNVISQENVETINVNGLPVISVVNPVPPAGATKPDSPAQFNVYTQNLPDKDTYIRITYQYRFGDRYTAYDGGYTTLLLPGVVHGYANTANVANKISDTTMFDTMCNTYGYALGNNDLKVIYVSDLAAVKDTFSCAGKALTSLNGVQYLKNTATLNFTSCGITNAIFTTSEPSFSELDYTSTVILTSNSLTNWSTDSRCWLQGMGGLKNLYINKNKIVHFYNLNSYPVLKYLAIDGQTDVGNPNFFGLFEIPLYGDDGIVNIGTIAAATAMGVAMDVTVSTTSNASYLESYNFLNDMAVQDKLTNTTTSVSYSNLYYDSPQAHAFLANVPRKTGWSGVKFKSRTVLTNANNISLQIDSTYSIIQTWRGQWSNVFARNYTYTQADVITNQTTTPVRPTGW